VPNPGLLKLTLSPSDKQPRIVLVRTTSAPRIVTQADAAAAQIDSEPLIGPVRDDQRAIIDGLPTPDAVVL